MTMRRTVVAYVGDQEQECRVTLTDLHFALAARHISRTCFEAPGGDDPQGAALVILTLAALTGRRLRSTDEPLPSGPRSGDVMLPFDYLEDEEP